MQVPREGLEQKLQKLSSSQASIESVSAFCIFYHKDARGVVQIWDQEFYKAPPERKMSLLYLANHVLQEGRRKGTGFTDEFYKVLPQAVSHLMQHGDEKSKKSVTRLVGVWEERRVFGSKHIKSFRELLPTGSSLRRASSSSSGSLKQFGQAGAALAAAQEAATAVAQKEQEFNRSWTPALLTTGGLDKVTTASNQLQALTAALQEERDARQAAIAALQAEMAAQAAAAGGLAQRITSCEQQQQQLQSRMGFLTAQMASVVAGLTGMAGLVPQQAANGSGATVAGGAAPALPDSVDSPQAPALEEEDDDMPQQQQQNPAGIGITDGGQAAGDPTGAIFAALSALPHDARDKMSTDMQQLLAMGLLGNTAPAVSTGVNVWSGGQQHQQELGIQLQPTTAAAGAAMLAQQVQQQQQPGWGDLGAAGGGFMGALGQMGVMGGLAVNQQGQADEEEEEPYDPENPL